MVRFGVLEERLSGWLCTRLKLEVVLSDNEVVAEGRAADLSAVEAVA